MRHQFRGDGPKLAEEGGTEGETDTCARCGTIDLVENFVDGPEDTQYEGRQLCNICHDAVMP